MLNQCQDQFYTTFGSYPQIEDYHKEQAKHSNWVRCKVTDISIEPLDKTSSLYTNPSRFAMGTSTEAVEDTADNLGLAINVGGDIYPMYNLSIGDDRCVIPGKEQVYADVSHD